jgi:lysophospholipase L1-like esterase
LDVRADACVDVSGGQGVRLIVDGGPGNGGAQTDDYSAPYAATVNGLSHGEHVVEAQVISSGGVPVSGAATYDRSTQVGIGDYYVAIGDGMTVGLGDDHPQNDNSQDGRTTRGGGYEAVLSDLLTAAKAYPVGVMNEGIEGTASFNGVTTIQSILDKHPNAQRIIIMYGHNDAVNSIPSGLGLPPGDPGYAGSFKDNMQRMINSVKASGKVALLAKAPAVLPVNSQRDLLVQQYNMVVDELAADPLNGIPVPPPDFHSYFASHQNEYADDILMNGTGYESMAQIWFNALNP